MHKLSSVFTSGASRYQRAAFVRPDSYFFHLIRFRAASDAMSILLLIHPSSRLTYSTNIVASGATELVDAIGDYCRSVAGGVGWLFEGSGDVLTELRRTRVEPHEQPERRMFDRFGIRLARAHASFWGAARSHMQFEELISHETKARENLDLAGWLSREVETFNSSPLATLRGSTPRQRFDEVRSRAAP